MNKSAASAASKDYVKLQAVIKSAASAASPCGGRASGRLDHGHFFAIFGRASGQKIAKFSDSVDGLKHKRRVPGCGTPPQWMPHDASVAAASHHVVCCLL